MSAQESKPTPLSETLALPAGWAWPDQSQKAHYFPAGSLVSGCGRWTSTGYRDEHVQSVSPDDCSPCRRAIARQ